MWWGKNMKLNTKPSFSQSSDGILYFRQILMFWICFKEFLWGSERQHRLWRRLHFWRPWAEYRLLRLWSGLASPSARLWWLPAPSTTRHGVSNFVNISPHILYCQHAIIPSNMQWMYRSQTHKVIGQDYSITNSGGPDFHPKKFIEAQHFQRLVVLN